MDGNLLSGAQGRETLVMNIQAEKFEYVEACLQEHQQMLEKQKIVQYCWSTGQHREDDTEK